jgi:hypothetical protein
VQGLHGEVAGVKEDVGRVAAGINALTEKLGNSGRTNWSVVIGATALASTIIGAIVASTVTPLRYADTVHERDMQAIQARQNQDHDTLIRLHERDMQAIQARQNQDHDTLIRLQERELIRRERGE